MDYTVKIHGLASTGWFMFNRSKNRHRGKGKKVSCYCIDVKEISVFAGNI